MRVHQQFLLTSTTDGVENSSQPQHTSLFWLISSHLRGHSDTWLSFFSLPPLDLCDATRRCWLLYTAIIQFMSGDQRRTRLLLTYLDPGIIKMPQAKCTPRVSCFLSYTCAPTTFWQTTVRSPRKSPNKVFSAQTPFFRSTSALAAPHFSKSARSIKTKPNKEL